MRASYTAESLRNLSLGGRDWALAIRQEVALGGVIGELFGNVIQLVSMCTSRFAWPCARRLDRFEDEDDDDVNI